MGSWLHAEQQLIYWLYYTHVKPNKYFETFYELLKNRILVKYIELFYLTVLQYCMAQMFDGDKF